MNTVKHPTASVDYSVLFAMLPNPHMVMSASDPFVIVAENEAHARLINSQEPTYSIGKGLLEAYPDTSDEFKKSGKSVLVESIKSVITTGEPDSMPDIRYDLADKSGTFSERWWRATHYPIKDEDGTVVQVLQLTNDITEELRSKNALEVTSRQLGLALSAGLVSSFTWNIADDVVIGDRNLAHKFGVSITDAAHGLPLQIFIDSIHPDDRIRVNRAIAETVATNKPYDIEYRTVSNDGTITWVLARGAVERNGDGDALTFLGILIDITDRKNAENELANSRMLVETLFASRVISVARADDDGRLLAANETFLNLFGYEQSDIKNGLNSRDLTPIRARPVTARIFDSIRTTGESQPVEKEYLKKDGSSFLGLVGAVRIPGTTEFIAFILDITETRRLKELNAAKDEFIALASHQLRTPATAVKQYIGLILEGFAGDVDETQRGYLQTANESNDRELTIINDLLKTAQLDTEGYNLKPKQTDLIVLVEDLAKEFLSVCEMKHQRLVVEHDEPLEAHIDVDETRIVLSNLIENAHKYSQENTTITVTVKKFGKNAKISVSDEGVGIAAKDINSVFEKFTRIENPLSDTAVGNGLGLYWVKRIVTLHGGTLDVQSTPGKGTTFTVQLPL